MANNQTTEGTEKPPGLIYDIDDRPPFGQLLAYAFQHMMVDFPSIGVPLAFAAITGIGRDETMMLISGCLIASGVVTIIQCLGVGPIGARLPIVNSVAFKFVGPLSLAYKGGGFGAVFGASIIGGFAMVIAGLFVGKLQRFFTPFLIGAILIVVGTSLMPIGFNNLLAIGKPYAGTTQALLVGAVPLAIMLFLTATQHPLFKRLRYLPVLIGFVVGYALSVALGMVDLGPVIAAPWIGFTVPFSAGTPSWPGLAVQITVIIVFVTAIAETAGDSSAVAAIMGRTATPQQLRGACIADGLSGPISAVFGGVPMTTYGQNVGMIRISGVASRYVVAGTGVLFIIFGTCPKFAALISIVPAPVLGAALVVSFGMIAIEGIRRVAPYIADVTNNRNFVVLLLGLAPAISLRLLPKPFLADIPSALAPLLTDALTTGLLVTMLAHLLIPERKTAPSE